MLIVGEGFRVCEVTGRCDEMDRVVKVTAIGGDEGVVLVQTSNETEKSSEQLMNVRRTRLVEAFVELGCGEEIRGDQRGRVELLQRDLHGVRGQFTETLQVLQMCGEKSTVIRWRVRGEMSVERASELPSTFDGGQGTRTDLKGIVEAE